jgi:hypothetical protein
MAHVIAVEVATKQNNVDSVKYCAKLSDKADSDASSDCFLIPGIPSLIPGWPGTTNQPITPTPPLISTPITPVTTTTPSTSTPTQIVYTPGTPTTPSTSTPTQIIYTPGNPTTPSISTPVTPTTTLTPSPPLLEVATKKNEVDGVKYCTKTSVEGNSDATSDCFIIPGVPGLPWWTWPFIPFPPTTPPTPSPSAAPATPSPSASPATPGSPKSSPLR